MGVISVGAIAALIVFGGYYVHAHVNDSIPPEWNHVLLGIVARLPIILPLMWLAIYSGHHYMMALRMSEEYGHKESVSNTFEGFKQQMIAVGDKAGAPATQLCSTTLTAIGRHPGDIYDKHPKVPGPLFGVQSELKEAFRVLSPTEPKKPDTDLHA